jgi:hypothetical protein
MTEDIPDEAKAQIDEQTRQQTAKQGLQANQRHVNERKFNPSFLERIQDPDLDSEIHSWVRSEFPALFSGAQVVGQRDPTFEQQQEFLNRSKAEKFVAEQSPGALLQRHPGVHATMEGAEAQTREPPTDAARAIQSDEKRVVRNAMELATTRQGLAVGARGLRSVTTATSETRTVRKEADDDDGILASATGVFG